MSVRAGESFYTMNRTIDANTGLATASYDVADLPTSLSYDSMGRLTLVAPSSGHGAQTHVQYNKATAATSLARVNVNRVSNDGSLTLSQEEYGFDAAGRLTRHRRKMPDGIWATSERRYNPQGWLTFASEAENATSPTKGTTFAGFDPFGRPSVIYGPDHNGTTNPYAVTTLSYSGDRVINRGSYVRTGGDANTLTQSISTTAYMFDRQGRLFRVTEPSRPTGAAALTQYGYHASGHVGSITTTGQEATQYRVLNYDGRGLLSFEQHPERGYSGTSLSAVGYGYDAVGQLRARQFLGTVLYYTYDIAGRLVSVSDHNSQTIKSFTYYGTNAAGRSKGKLWTATRYNYLAPKIGRDVTITETYQYGGRDGRVSQRSTSSSEGVNFSQSWTYNDLGHPVSIEYPECTGGCPYAATDTISSTYAESFLRSIPSWATEIAYHPNGLVSRIDYADGAKWHQLADASGIARPSVISTSSGGVTTWQTGMYKYDGSGNVAAIGSDYFTYDLVGRLKLGTAFQAGNRRQEYTYDTFGNITSTKTYQNGSLTSTRAPGINSAMNRLSGGYANYYTDGNLGSIQTEGVGYEWDQVNRLRSFSFLRLGVNRTWVYAYTADDERIWSYDVTGNASWWRVRDLDQKVLAEFTNAGASGWSGYKTYVYQNGRLLGANTPYEPTGARKYFATDHLGTPRRIATSAESIAYHQYYPFGEEATHPATDQERMKFTGHERDLCCDGYTNYSDNMHARVYNPIHGRFLSPDPVLGNLLRPQSWNRYAYVLGNPMNYVDPDGRQLVIVAEHPHDDLSEEFGRLDKGPRRGGPERGWSVTTAPCKSDWTAMDLADTIANISAGFGDGIIATLSLGSISGDTLRSLTGADQMVNMNSGQYLGGRISGTAATLAVYAGGAIPATLTHFTTRAGAASIASSGIAPSSGLTLSVMVSTQPPVVVFSCLRLRAFQSPYQAAGSCACFPMPLF